MSSYIVLDVSDSRDFCQCCGRAGLKRVVFIENVETGNVKHFGTSCAQSPEKALGVNSEIKKAIKKHEAKQAAVFRFAHHEYKSRGGKYDRASESLLALDDVLFSECLDFAKSEYVFLMARSAKDAH